MSVTDEIKARLDIVEVISPYVQLKKAGRNYQGLCPFHNEKTPSFVVFPDTQGWHCFGACATGGDVFSFVMKRENLDFGEALRLLAERAGVELQPRQLALPAEEQRLERLRQIMAEAAGHFHYLLSRSAEAQIARDYLARRGLTPATWEAWQLGYALDSWDALRDRLTAKGYTLAEIEETGLIIRREDGSGYYDRFRGRLMIPIRDVQGRAVGFGARLLREDPGRPQPKYINSPQSPLFDKGGMLYGLDMARKAIRDANLVVVVEGYMDVLMSHQVGVSNVVAGMGTALTEAHIRQLKRYTGNITLALDPDAAGDHAVLRGLETARQALEREWEPVFSPTGLVRQESRLRAQLRIAALPDGLDPDELAYANVARWREVIEQAQPIVEYYLALVAREEDLATARGKANAVERLAPLIGEIARPVEREHYIQRLARLAQSDERLVAEQVTRAARRPAAVSAGPVAGSGADQAAGPAVTSPEGAAASAPAGGKQRRSPGSAAAHLEAHILGCLLARPDLAAQLDADMIAAGAAPLDTDDFAEAELRVVVTALQSGALLDTSSDTPAWPADWPSALQERCAALADDARRQPSLADDKLLKDLGDSLLRLRERNLRAQIQQVKHLMAESAGAEAAADARRYHETMVIYTARKLQVDKLLNARSMAGALAQAQRKD